MTRENEKDREREIESERQREREKESERQREREREKINVCVCVCEFVSVVERYNQRKCLNVLHSELVTKGNVLRENISKIELRNYVDDKLSISTE